jgi:hypothetical protein
MLLVIDKVTVPVQLREPGRGLADTEHPDSTHEFTLTLPTMPVALSDEQPTAASSNTETHNRSFNIGARPGVVCLRLEVRVSRVR